MSVDPLSGDYPALSCYTFVANNPLLLFDPNGMELKTSGDSAAGHSVLGYISGLSDREFASRYRNNKGVVDFDFSGLDLENEGLKLLNNLIGSKQVYLLALEQVDNPIHGERVLSRFGRDERSDRPDIGLPEGCDGYVLVATNVSFVDEVRHLEVSRENIAWHALAECYARTDGHQKYAYSDRLLNRIGDYYDYEGAHHTAMERTYTWMVQGYGSGHQLLWPHSIRMRIR